MVDRCFLVECDITIDFVGAGNGSNLLQPNCDAPRSLSNIISNTNLTVNGLTISQETRYLYHAFQHFNHKDQQTTFQSLTPGFLSGDYSQTYEEVFGTSVNPLADYKDSTRSRFGRGSYPFTIVSNTQNAAQVSFKLYELITMSPLIFDDGLYPGLCNVTSLQLSFTLQNLQRIWSHSTSGGAIITGATVQIGESFCHFTEISTPVYMSIPPVCTLSYYDIQRQTSNNHTIIAPGATATLSSNSYQLNQVPSRIIIFAKEQESTIYDTDEHMINKPDAYGAIENCSIQLDNQSSLLSQASQQQLYMISSRNGVDMSYAEWIGETTIINPILGESSSKLGLTGSLLTLDFGQDLSADPTFLPSVSVNSNFSVSVRVKNTSLVSKSYDLTILYVYAGALILSPGSAYKYSTLFTREQSLSLPLIEGSGGSKEFTGGDFKGFMKKMGSSFNRALEQPAFRNMISSGMDIGAAAATPYLGAAAPALRAGVKQLSGLGMMGGGMTGGSLLNKNKLKNRY